MNEIDNEGIVLAMSKQIARQTDNAIYGFIEDIDTEYGIKRYIHADKETIANALMEYPKYRELGTVEECRKAVELYTKSKTTTVVPDDSVVIVLSKRDAEVMNTLLSAEIMKLDLHYGSQKHTERQDTCYAIRDKIIGGKDK